MLCLALIALLFIGWSIYRIPPKTSPKWQTERQNGVLQGSLAITQDNSLLPISHLPPTPETHIFAVLVEDREIVINNYCDWDYLKQWWPEEILWWATNICWEESQGDPTRINDSLYGVVELSCGIWQINILAHPEYTCEEMKDPVKSTLAAIKIQKSEGWEAWWHSLQKIKKRNNLP